MMGRGVQIANAGLQDTHTLWPTAPELEEDGHVCITEDLCFIIVD